MTTPPWWFHVALQRHDHQHNEQESKDAAGRRNNNGHRAGVDLH